MRALRPATDRHRSPWPVKRIVEVGVPLVVAALLLLSGLADRATVIPPTVRDAPSATSKDTDLASLARDLAGDTHYAHYMAMREHGGGALVVLDDALPTGVLGERADVLMHEPYLHALAGASRIVRQELVLPPMLGVAPAAEGSYLGRPWRLVVDAAAGPATVLLIWEDSGVHWIVDERVLPDPFGVSMRQTEGIGSSVRPTLSVPAAAVVDASILIVLLLAGGSLLPSGALPKTVRLVLALLVGVALQATIGLLLRPGAWSVGAALALAVAAGRFASRRHGPLGWVRSDIPTIVAASGALVMIAVTARSQRLIWVSPDSVNYLSQARMLADGMLGSGLLELKRGIGQQSLHAPGFALGAEGLQSLGSALLVAAVLMVALLPKLLDPRPHRATRLGAALFAGVLLAAPAVPIMATYKNSHLLVAVLLLALVVLLGVGQGGFPGPAAVPVVTALVVLRPEGGILAAILLLAADSRRDEPHDGLWYALGSSTLVWHLLLGYGAVQQGLPMSLPILAMGALGVGSLLVPLVLAALPEPLRQAAPTLLATTLWAAAVGMIVIGGEQVGYVRAVVANLGGGEGRWGVFGLGMFLAAMIALAGRLGASSPPGLVAARVLLVSFLPLTVLAKLADGLERPGSSVATLATGGGRIGWGDSVNRMWTHGILIIMLLLVGRLAGSLRTSKLEAKVPADG